MGLVPYSSGEGQFGRTFKLFSTHEVSSKIAWRVRTARLFCGIPILPTVPQSSVRLSLLLDRMLIPLLHYRARQELVVPR